jgi:hypothetical protein
MLDRIESFLIPEKHRRFITFKYMTLFVVLVCTSNMVVAHLIFPFPDDNWALLQAPEAQLLRTPSFLISYNAGVALAFFALYLTRHTVRYYPLRVVVYGMMLGAVAGQLVFFSLLLRT